MGGDLRAFYAKSMEVLFSLEDLDVEPIIVLHGNGIWKETTMKTENTRVLCL